MPWRHQFRMTASRGFRARPVVAVERAGRHVVIELRAIGGELRLKSVEDLLGQTARIGRRLHHQRRHRADDGRFRHPAFAVARQIMHHLAAASGMADMDRVFQIQMFGQRREIVGIVIHVMAVGGLAGAAMAAPVMGDDPKTLVQEEHHLRVPVIGRQRPAMAEHDGLTFTPVLVIDLDAVLGLNRCHPYTPARSNLANS